MDSSEHGQHLPFEEASSPTTSEHALDPGLVGERAERKYALMRARLAPQGAESFDPEVLKRIGMLLGAGELSLRDALEAYAKHSHAKRWPIVVVDPSTPGDLTKVQQRINALGFRIDLSLVPAYSNLGLMPVRVPPEPAFMRALAGMESIGRIERSWLRGQLPVLGHIRPDGITHPDHIFKRDILASELLTKRDPMRVGLIDTGIDATHTALKQRLIDQRSFRRKADDNGDQIGHGTAIAGIIARLCASAYFLSAKVFDRKSQTNLDDVLRGLGWVVRHRPDLIVCSVSCDLPPDGRSILARALRRVAASGPLVLVATRDTDGTLAAPMAAGGGVLCIAPDTAPTPETADTLRVPNHTILTAMGLQANKEHFTRLEEGWTSIAGPSACIAQVAGAAALMLRAARLSSHIPSAAEIKAALIKGRHPSTRLFSIDRAVHHYISQLAKITQENAPLHTPNGEQTTAIAITSSAPWDGQLRAKEAVTAQLPPRLRSSDLPKPPAPPSDGEADDTVLDPSIPLHELVSRIDAAQNNAPNTPPARPEMAKTVKLDPEALKDQDPGSTQPLRWVDPNER